MSSIDVLVTIIVLYSAFLGSKKGLVRIIFDVTALLVAIASGLYYYSPMALYLVDLIPISLAGLKALSFVLVCIPVFFFISLTGILLDKMVAISGFGGVNRLGGLLLGGVKAAIFLVPLAFFNFSFLEGSILIDTARPYLHTFEKNIKNMLRS